MIVLNVTYKCKPGKREAFLKMIATEGIDAASRAEGAVDRARADASGHRRDTRRVQLWPDGLSQEL